MTVSLLLWYRFWDESLTRPEVLEHSSPTACFFHGHAARTVGKIGHQEQVHEHTVPHADDCSRRLAACLD
jgi:hypothetical protein